MNDHRTTGVIWLAVWMVAMVVRPPCSADEDGPMPTPDQIVGESWPEELPPVAAPQIAAAYRRPAVSDWDLYAGSVYANTSPLWLQAEYVLGWISGNQLPALVSTGAAGTPIGEAGVPGGAGTRILFGDQRVDGQARSGFRTSLGVRLGHWFDTLMDAELVGDYFWLGDGQTSGDFLAIAPGDMILARPYFDAQSLEPAAELIAFPDLLAGGIRIETASQLRSAGVTFRRAWRRGDRGRIDWLAGYRYTELQEQLVVADSSLDLQDGTRWDVVDEFRTWNEFHGVDLGLQYWTAARGWTLELVAKLALGGVARTLEIDGATRLEDGAGNVIFGSGGFLALGTNQGRHQSSRFAPLPELNLKVRRQMTRNLILTMGYSVMIVDQVIRTGDQIDLTIDPTLFAGQPGVGIGRPRVSMSESTLWVHGLHVGLEW